MNLDEVLTYNHMVIMSLRSRCHVTASMVNESRSIIYTLLYIYIYIIISIDIVSIR